MTQNKYRYVEILDTTLRDGEQTPGVAFTPAEKLQMARFLLTKLKVDRLEIASARVSSGEAAGVRNIIEWAAKRGHLEQIEILGFVDDGKSINWICENGGKVINILAKGSQTHCEIQLRKTPLEHFTQVGNNIQMALDRGLKVNVYLEDWSNGMAKSPVYVFNFIEYLLQYNIERIMLPDTLGVLIPEKCAEYVKWLTAMFPDIKFDFHGHNDYGLVTANSWAAVKNGVSGIHTTINGMGERTGNQPLSQLVVLLNDMSNFRCHVAEKQLKDASDLVQAVSGKRIAWNAPVVGGDVFTQTCGVHADGDKKGDLYANKLLPERFGRTRNYALGKLSGKASLEKNLESMDLELDDETRKKVLQEIIRLGDKKKNVTPADLPFIIAAVLRTPLSTKVKILDYNIESRHGVTPRALVKMQYHEQFIEAESNGDGGYDAFMKSVRKALKSLNISVPKLRDYEVRIPPGGKTDALVETTITWEAENGGRGLITTGVDSDQLVAAITATEKMLNLVLGE